MDKQDREVIGMVNSNAEISELERKLGTISARRMDFRFCNIIEDVAVVLGIVASVGVLGVLIWL